MPLSYNQYSGNGTAKVFNLTFPYIHRDHIEIKVNGYDQKFSWNSPTQVELLTAPAKGDVIDIRRVTPRDKVMVKFQDASTLVETDLDLSTIQVFYIAQETLDLGEASMGVTPDGSFSALFRRISNVLDPVLDQDAATKKWVETAHSSQLKQATDQANKSTASADRSDARANASDASAVRSEKAAAASEASAVRSDTRANASNASAVRSETAAKSTSADREETARNVTRTADNVTTSKRHADDAEASAKRAATFDPSSYYEKTEVDKKLDGKLSSTGGTVKGDLTVTGGVNSGGIRASWLKITGAGQPVNGDDAAPKAFVERLSLGTGQDWHNVTGARGRDSSYHNNTGRNILVSVSGPNNVDGMYFDVSPDNANWRTAGKVKYSATTLVPAGWWYRVVGGTVQYWVELR